MLGLQLNAIWPVFLVTPNALILINFLRLAHQPEKGPGRDCGLGTGPDLSLSLETEPGVTAGRSRCRFMSTRQRNSVNKWSAGNKKRQRQMAKRRPSRPCCHCPACVLCVEPWKWKWKFMRTNYRAQMRRVRVIKTPAPTPANSSSSTDHYSPPVGPSSCARLSSVVLSPSLVRCQPRWS